MPRFPANRFLVSVLSRENQHELGLRAEVQQLDAVRLLVVHEQSSIVEEITRERIEMLGQVSFRSIPMPAVLEQSSTSGTTRAGRWRASSLTPTVFVGGRSGRHAR